MIGKDAIVPDLIVHRVGKRENLLVVEVKKSSVSLYVAVSRIFQFAAHMAVFVSSGIKESPKVPIS